MPDISEINDSQSDRLNVCLRILKQENVPLETTLATLILLPLVLDKSDTKACLAAVDAIPWNLVVNMILNPSSSAIASEMQKAGSFIWTGLATTPELSAHPQLVSFVPVILSNLEMLREVSDEEFKRVLQALIFTTKALNPSTCTAVWKEKSIESLLSQATDKILSEDERKMAGLIIQNIVTALGPTLSANDSLAKRLLKVSASQFCQDTSHLRFVWMNICTSLSCSLPEADLFSLDCTDGICTGIYSVIQNKLPKEIMNSVLHLASIHITQISFSSISLSPKEKSQCICLLIHLASAEIRYLLELRKTASSESLLHSCGKLVVTGMRIMADLMQENDDSWSADLILSALTALDDMVDAISDYLREKWDLDPTNHDRQNTMLLSIFGFYSTMIFVEGNEPSHPKTNKHRQRCLKLMPLICHTIAEELKTDTVIGNLVEMILSVVAVDEELLESFMEHGGLDVLQKSFTARQAIDPYQASAIKELLELVEKRLEAISS